MSSKHVLFDVNNNGIGIITLNKPERLNAIDPEMRDNLGEFLDKSMSDDAVKVVVITGAGRAFCAGGDLKSMPDRFKKTIIERRDYLRTSNENVRKIRDMDKPVIAAVNGDAVGAGCNLALACDMRVASAKARFGEVFVKRGMHPDWGGVYNLTRLVGTAKACEMIFTGDLIDAEEAKAIGIVNRVYPDNEFEAKWNEFAQQMANGPPISIRMAKMAIHKSDNIDLQTAMELEAYAQAIVAQTEDVTEGIKAFNEKRKPVFKGK